MFYFFLLIHLISRNIIPFVKEHSIARNGTIGRVSHWLSILPILPENLLGPLVLPSKCKNNALKGNSLKCNKHTSHWNGLLKCSSIRRIIPPLFPKNYIIKIYHSVTVFFVYRTCIDVSSVRSDSMY